MAPLPVLLALVALASSPSAPVASALPLSSAGTDDPVREFERYYKKYDDAPTRVEAVLGLEGIESPSVVDGLVIVFKGDDPAVWAAAIRVLGGFESRPPVERMLELLGGGTREAVRIGLLRALTRGSYGGILAALTPGLTTSSWAVRRWSLKALAASRDPAGEAHLLAACADPETAVRCAALEGLADLGVPSVIPIGIENLAHAVWQVRACAVGVLGSVRDARSIGPLIERMQIEEGRLLADINASLGSLTGRDFGPRPDGWQRFWDTYRDRFTLPTDAEMERLTAVRAARAASYDHNDATSYHGIVTPSQAMLFILDVSASMEHEVSDRAAFEGYDSFQRIEIAKAELIRTIDGLGPEVKFNVIAFASEIKTWRRGLANSSKGLRDNAKRWVGRLHAVTGSREQDIAAIANLTSAVGGKTNTFGALTFALDAAGRGVRDKHYEVGVDTIFFLSDGEPSTGEFVDTDDIVREIGQVNSLRRVVIHTIAIGEFEKDFMQQLALTSGGTFVDLGH